MALTRVRAENILDSDFKNSCRATSFTNITLSGGAPNATDNVNLVANDRILVQGQNTASQNGIYYVNTLGSGSNGTWLRAPDATQPNSMTTGLLVYVNEGTNYGQKFYYITTTGTITVGSTSITFANLGSNFSNVTAQNLTASTAIYSPAYYYANGTAFSGSGGGSYGNAQVAQYLPTYSGNLTAGNITVNGNLFVTGNITTLNYETVNNTEYANSIIASGSITAAGGFNWSNGNAYGGYFTVSEINAANAYSNVLTNITTLRFDTATGFHVYPWGNNTAKIALGSSFSTWYVAGQGNLKAVGEDTVQFIAGSGISITTNNSSIPQSITISSTGTYSNSNVASYLPTYTGTLSPSSITTNSGGQISGYLTGAIGANSANSGAFTTLAATSTITAQGTVSAPTINAGTIGNSGATLTGTLSTASQTNITSVGTLTSLNSTGTIAAPTVIAATIGNAGAVIYGTLNSQSASQTNITSVGTLIGLTTSGNITAQTANIYAGNIIANTAIYGAAFYFANGTPFTSSSYGNTQVAAYLPTYSGTLSPSSLTTSSGGQVVAYLTGAIGANTANSGAFTTVVASGNITAQTANVYAAYVVANSGLKGTLITNAQTNITSVGTLGSLTVTGAVQANTYTGVAVYAGTIGNSGSTLTGTLSTAAQNNITSVGTLTGLVSSANITAQAANMYAAYVVANSGLSGTLITAAQNNITSVGTLTGLTVSSAINADITGNAGGNAGTATKWQNPIYINGVAVDGTASINITIAASALTGSSLAANVVNSSLTSVGTLTSLNASGNISTSASLVATNGVYSDTAYANTVYAGIINATTIPTVSAYNTYFLTSDVSFSTYSTTLANSSVVVSFPTITLDSSNGYCMEFFVNFDSLDLTNTAYFNDTGTTAVSIDFSQTGITINSHGYTSNTTNFDLANGVWYHIALIGTGNIAYWAVNGVVKSTGFGGGYSGSDQLTTLDVYKFYGGSAKFSNFRIVKNSSVYSTSGFVPPGQPLTAITNTNLLILKSASFTDASSYNRSITTSNSPTLSVDTISIPGTTSTVGSVISGVVTVLSVTSSRNITAAANVYAGNIIANTATYSAAYYYSNGTAFTGSSTYGNTQVAAYLPTYNGALTAANLTTTSGGQVKGYLTGAIGANTANSAAFTTVVASGNITAQTANVYAGNIIANTAIYGAAYYYANGTAFTGSGGSTYGNTQVAAYLPTYNGNISVTNLNGSGTATINAIIANGGTSSTSTTSGALIVQGGAGISGALYVGGSLSIAGNTTFINTTIINTTDTISAPAINAGTIGNSGATLIGTLSTAAQTNITSVGTLGSLTVSGTTNLQGTTNGATINATTIQGGTIGNSGATLTGTLSTAAQTNITSVGQLTSLNVTGTTTTNQLQAGLIGNSGSLLQGTLITAAQGNITSVGTLTSLTSTGTIAANQVQAGVLGNSGALLIGTLTTAAQGNITSVGTLGSLTVSGTTNLQGTTNGATINATNLYATTIGNTATAINGNLINGSAVYAGTIGNSGATLTGTLSTAAQTNITSVGTLQSLNTSGNITAQTANVYAANIIGNTAIYGAAYYYANGTAFTGSSYGNTQVGAYLVNYNGNIGLTNLNGSGTATINAIIANGGTSSTSTTSGALIVQGGAGISGSLYVGGSLSIAGNTTFINTTIINTTDTISAPAINAGIIGNSGATLTGTLSTAAQTNITSVGTLGSLTVTGAVNGNTFNGVAVYGGTIGNTGTTLTGTLSTAAQTNITSVGTLSGLVSSANITAQTANVYAAYVVANSGLSGALITNAQTNITSVGTLTSLTSSGNINTSASLVANNVYANSVYPNTVTAGNTIIDINSVRLQNTILTSVYNTFSSYSTNLSSSGVIVSFPIITLDSSVGYCMEFFIKFSSLSGTSTPYFNNITNAQVSINFSTTGITINSHGFSTNTTNFTLTNGVWYHIALIGTGSTAYWAVNGVVKSTGFGGGYSGSDPLTTLDIYKFYGAATYSNFRIVTGSPVYSTLGFAPPGAALTAISGTQLLTLQNSTFVDNSGTSTTISTTGSPTLASDTVGAATGLPSSVGSIVNGVGTFANIIVAGTSQAASFTASGGGQLTGYHTGAIGANTANSGAFTTVSASGNITAQTANVYAANVIGNTAIYGAAFYFANGTPLTSSSYGNTQVAAYLPTYTGTLSPSSLTTSSGGQLTGYHTGAIGANSANSGAFTTLTATSTITAQGTVAAPTINASTIGNSGAILYGTLNTSSAAQPNITSVGTLTSLNSSGTVAAPTVIAATIGNAGAVLYGTLNSQSASQTNITSVGTLGSLTVSGTTNLQGTTSGATINATNLYATTIGNTAAAINGNLINGSAVYAGTIGNSGATLTGTLSTAAQTNITSVGTLTGLVSSANITAQTANVYAANIIGNTAIYGAAYYYANGLAFTGGGGSTSPGGANTMVQFNNSGSFAGATYLQYNITSGNLVSNSTTTSISTTTGAIVVAGGMGIGGNLYVGGNLSIAGNTTFINTTTISTTDTIAAPTINAGTIGNTGATLTGTLSTAAQTNITSVGTLGSLTVSGTTNLQGTTNGATINATNLYATTIGNTAAAINGNLINGSAVYAGTIGNTGATLTGTLSTAAQTNITSIGTLSSLTVSGTTNLQGTTNGATINATTIQGGTIGNSGATFTGATQTLTGASQAASFTTSSGGQLTGYLTGAIGANSANTGAFTTLTASGNTTLNNYANIYIATGSTASTSALSIVGNIYGQGGTGYLDFLKLTNTYSAGTNPNKYFRLNSTGGLEVVNSAYSQTIFILSDTGSITIPTTATATVGNLVTTNGVYWPNGSVYSSGGSGSPGGSSTQIQFNSGGTFGGATSLQYISASGNLVSSSTTASTNNTTGAIVVSGGIGVGGNVTADIVHATNNGNGTNFQIGDDLWLGDINVSNTARVMGQQDNTQGYIVFGSTNATNYIGRSGSNPITVTGAFNVTGTTNLQGTTNGTTINATTIQGGTIGNSGATLTGTLSTAAQTNITSVGILTGLVSSANITAQTANVYAAYVVANSGLSGTLITNAQTNITSTGSLTSPSFTTSGGGQHVGYHTGAIGANTANSGSFTTVTVSGITNLQGNTNGATVNAANVYATTIGNVNANGNITTLSGTLVSTVSNSIFFNGSNSSVSGTVAAVNGNFTMEAWVYPSTLASSGTPGVISIMNGTGTNTGFWIWVDTTGWYVRNLAGNFLTYTSSPPSNNKWYHVALVRNGATTSLYINGVSVASTASALTLTDTTFIAGDFNTSGGHNYFTGYITGIRYVNGTAVYTANFTPSYAPATSIANTALLLDVTSSAAYLTDGSSAAVTVTATGLPTFSTLSYANTFVTASYIASPFLYANSNTGSTSTTTGTMVITGGAGISGNLYVGNIVTTSGIFYPNGSTAGGGGGSSTAAGANTAIQFANGTAFGGATYLQYNYVSGNLVSNSTTTSTSTTTGAIVVGGGVGIAGNLYVGGNLSIAGNTTFINTTTITTTDTIAAPAINAGTIGNSGATFSGASGTLTGLFTASNLNLSLTTASAVTAVLTRGSDPNFQLTSQNGSSSNATGAETARFGVNYSGTGWDSFIQFVRGSGAQSGSLALWAGNIAVANVASTSIYPVSNNSITLGGASSQYFSAIYANNHYGSNYNGATVVTTGNIYSGGNIVAASGTATNSTTTGAIVVTGGAGIAGNVYTGGNIYTQQRTGYTYSGNNTSVAYTYYNATTNSLDTVFG